MNKNRRGDGSPDICPMCFKPFRSPGRFGAACLARLDDQETGRMIQRAMHKEGIERDETWIAELTREQRSDLWLWLFNSEVRPTWLTECDALNVDDSSTEL